MEKRCKGCNKILEIKEFKIRINPKRKFCDIKCKAKYNYRRLYHEKYKYEDSYKERKKKGMVDWYDKNKDKQFENVRKNYRDNVSIWNERKFTNHHRIEILEILPKNCANCGILGINVIHHKEYGKTPKLEHHGPNAKNKNKPKLEKYCGEYLLGFCSMNCHKNYEFKLREHQK